MGVDEVAAERRSILNEAWEMPNGADLVLGYLKKWALIDYELGKKNQIVDGGLTRSEASCVAAMKMDVEGLTIEELKAKIESLDRALELPLTDAERNDYLRYRQEYGAELARLTCLRHGGCGQRI